MLQQHLLVSKQPAVPASFPVATTTASNTGTMTITPPVMAGAAHGLEGNVCTGCMGSCCCACCELMQTSKELDYILLEKNAGANGYQPQPGMVAGPQAGAYQ
ncbi:hypothetical protein SBOR_3369 [Sclerotinia borealis F-4128]|uniref:Uncharacterized protein n=1 Tax=Sclerotinia borealis (strain F-4128) TaxID=1432307 RepID=W9CK13_SCLBF|nr:hypothetical protein SBOR_3369 [Sclerotinia borealis F-4128]